MSNEEYNYYPITVTSSSKEGTPDKPQSNTQNVGQPVNIDKSSVSESNIVSIAGGALLKSGYFQSSNYVKGKSGFNINSDGSVEFGDGEFRGEITATTGAIGGFNIGADYLRDVANSFGLASTVTGGNDVRFWAGDSFANRATADLRIYEDGSIVGTNATFTGALNATSGWIGSATALVYESQGINTGVTGFIRGGQTSYNTGTGYFLGYDIDKYKLSIGDTTTGNYLTWDGTDLIVNDSILSNNTFFGDGNDGDVTISSDTNFTADIYANNFTVQVGNTVDLKGYRLFVKNTLTNAGVIHNRGTNGGNAGNGGDGKLGPTSTPTGGGAGTAGVTGSSAFFLTGQDGVVGKVGGGAGVTGNSGTNQTNALGSDGVNGTSGGNGGNGQNAGGGYLPYIGYTGGGGGAKGTITAPAIIPRSYVELILMRDFYSTTSTKLNSSAGSASGGSGGGGGRTSGTGGNILYGGAGGGSAGTGGAGGIILIAARKIINTGTISSAGGDGGIGGNGGAGVYDVNSTYSSGPGGGGAGGCGGSGGVLVLLYSSLTDTGSITVAGGTGGTGGLAGTQASPVDGSTAATAGADGNTGETGYLVTLQI